MTAPLILILILILHGLIHLLGFISEFKLATIKQFSGIKLFESGPLLSKILGISWLLSCLLFLFAALFLFLGSESWWIIGLTAIILSQLLIIINWKDARAGTVLNIIILLAALMGYGNWEFNKMVKDEVQEIYARNPGNQAYVLQPQMFNGLPSCVRLWLFTSNLTGKEMIQNLRLKQKGQMNTKKDGKWMSFEAEQYFTVQRPAFIWKAKVDMGAGLFMTARDKYNKGQGNMKIQVLSLYTVANKTGKETDQGTLLRYLAEMAWFPSGALSQYISWTPIDSLSARATMSYKNMTASGVFTFTAGGDLRSFDALRYGDFDGIMRQERWHIDYKETKEVQGIRIPTACAVTWKLKSGDWTWLKLELTEAEFNKTGVYE